MLIKCKCITWLMRSSLTPRPASLYWIFVSFLISFKVEAQSYSSVACLSPLCEHHVRQTFQLFARGCADAFQTVPTRIEPHLRRETPVTQMISFHDLLSENSPCIAPESFQCRYFWIPPKAVCHLETAATHDGRYS